MPPFDAHARFDALFESHRGPVYAYLLGRTGDRDRAADLLQETFVRVWRHLDDAWAVPEDRRRFYLLRLAANVANDAGRRAKTRAHLEYPLEPVALRVAAAGPAMETDAFAAAVDGAIAALPEELRTVLSMQVLGGLTSAEIGDALGRPAGTVRAMLHEARKKLERSLIAWSPEGPK
ncbi:MAG: RNA polymerase sigma factor [Fimbriimonas sp.]